MAQNIANDAFRPLVTRVERLLPLARTVPDRGPSHVRRALGGECCNGTASRLTSPAGNAAIIAATAVVTKDVLA